jgi:hypothetical protein
MTCRVYCLECNAILGEDSDGAEPDRNVELGLCQTCAQHLPPVPDPSPAPSSRRAWVGLWEWLTH